MKKKRNSYPKGLHLEYMIDMLKVAKQKPSFSVYFLKSKIKLKKGFLKYLDYFMKKKLIKKTKWKVKKHNIPRTIGTPYTRYELTKNGKLFLRILNES